MSSVIGDSCKRMCLCGAAFEGTKAASFEAREQHLAEGMAKPTASLPMGAGTHPEAVKRRLGVR
jgi:hypothetical protein